MSNKATSKPVLFLAAGVATLAGIGAYAWHDEHRRPVLEVSIFDTPGAPAVFIRTPGDRRILIDGGSNADVVRRLSGILPFYSRRIDIVIVSAPESRRVTGLIDVLQRYIIDEVIMPEITLDSLGLASSSDQVYGIFVETIRARGIQPRTIKEGDTIYLDDRLVIEALFPAVPEQFAYSKASSPSILWRLRHGSIEMVMAGFATPKIQKYLADKLAVDSVGTSGAADILILSTSPSASNLSDELMRAVKPEYIVYSQAVQNSASKSPDSSSANKKADPLAGFFQDRRFNIREKGSVLVVSDEESVTVSSER